MMLLNDQKYEMGRKTMKDKFFLPRNVLLLTKMLKRKIHLADLDKTAILPFRTKITKIWDKKLSNTANPSLRTVPK